MSGIIPKTESGTGKSWVHHRMIALCCCVLGAAAIGLRFWRLGERSLWRDEGWVANAAAGGWQEILRPDLVAPKLFLFTIAGAMRLFGREEAALRLFPAICATASIVLVFHLCVLYRPRSFAVPIIGISLIGFSPVLVMYAQELKQYSSDIFFVLLTWFLTEKFVRASTGAKGFLALGLAAGLGIGFSFPFILFLPAIPLRLALDFRSRHAARSEWVSLFAFTAGMGILAAVLYLTMKPVPAADFNEYWERLFLRRPGTGNLIRYGISGFADFVEFLFPPDWHAAGPWFKYPPIALFLVGIWSVIRKDGLPAALYPIVTVLAAIAGGALHCYPYGGTRVSLFLAPLLFIFCAIGADAVLTALVGRASLRALAAVVIAGYPPFVGFIRNGGQWPTHRQELRAIADAYRKARAESDLTYVYWSAESAFKFYVPDRPRRILFGTHHRPGSPEYLGELARGFPDLEGRRLWLVFQREESDVENLENQKLVEEALRSRCSPAESLKSTGAAIVAFQC